MIGFEPTFAGLSIDPPWSACAFHSKIIDGILFLVDGQGQNLMKLFPEKGGFLYLSLFFLSRL